MKRYGAYYRKAILGKQENSQETVYTKRKCWKNQRYRKYYEKIMEPINEERWREIRKRIKSLKKEIQSCTIAKKTDSLGKVVKSFLSIINIATQFVDIGKITFMPANKEETIDNFNYIVETIAGRNGANMRYVNKSRKGATTKKEDIWLRSLKPITIGVAQLPVDEIICIAGKMYIEEVRYAPLSEWIYGHVISKDGHLTNITKGGLFLCTKNLTNLLLEAIEDVLN